MLSSPSRVWALVKKLTNTDGLCVCVCVVFASNDGWSAGRMIRKATLHQNSKGSTRGLEKKQTSCVERCS